MKWTKELPDLLSLFERTAGRGSRMNLRQASKESRINEAMLVETFGQWTGMPPMKYLERRRAQHAARQMLAGRATDDTIAERTGFNNLARFGEQMKATFGRSAAEYRSDFCS